MISNSLLNELEIRQNLLRRMLGLNIFTHVTPLNEDQIYSKHNIFCLDQILRVYDTCQ